MKCFIYCSVILACVSVLHATESLSRHTRQVEYAVGEAAADTTHPRTEYALPSYNARSPLTSSSYPGDLSAFLDSTPKLKPTSTSAELRPKAQAKSTQDDSAKDEGTKQKTNKDRKMDRILTKRTSVPYDRSGIKFDSPPNVDRYTPSAASPPYRTYREHGDGGDSGEYNPVRVARGYEESYDQNYNPSPMPTSSSSREEQGHKFNDRHYDDRYESSPIESSRHNGDSGTRYDYSAERAGAVSGGSDRTMHEKDDFHPEDRRNYDSIRSDEGHPPPMPQAESLKGEPLDRPLPEALPYTNSKGKPRRRGKKYRAGKQKKVHPLRIVYAIPQPDGSFKLRQGKKTKAIQINLKDQDEAEHKHMKAKTKKTIPSLEVPINDDSHEFSSTEELILNAARKPSAEPIIHHNPVFLATAEKEPQKSTGLSGFLGRWNPLGGWGLSSWFSSGSRKKENPKPVTASLIPQETIMFLDDNDKPLSSVDFSNIESVPHIHRFRPDPHHEIIVRHGPINKRSDDSDAKTEETSSKAQIKKHRSKRSATGNKGNSETKKDGHQASASGFLAHFADDDDDSSYGYSPYTIDTISSLANLFNDEPQKEERQQPTVRYQNQRKTSQVRFPQNDQREQAQSAQARHQDDTNYSTLGSGNFEVIRGGIFHSDDASHNNRLGSGNSYYRSNHNNPYRVVMQPISAGRHHQRDRQSYEMIDDDDTDDQVLGFQGFEDFAAPLNNALSRNRHILGVAASEGKPTIRNSDEAPKDDHMPSRQTRRTGSGQNRDLGFEDVKSDTLPSEALAPTRSNRRGPPPPRVTLPQPGSSFRNLRQPLNTIAVPQQPVLPAGTPIGFNVSPYPFGDEPDDAPPRRPVPPPQGRTVPPPPSGAVRSQVVPQFPVPPAARRSSDDLPADFPSQAPPPPSPINGNHREGRQLSEQRPNVPPETVTLHPEIPLTYDPKNPKPRKALPGPAPPPPLPGNAHLPILPNMPTPVQTPKTSDLASLSGGAKEFRGTSNNNNRRRKKSKTTKTEDNIRGGVSTTSRGAPQPQRVPPAHQRGVPQRQTPLSNTVATRTHQRGNLPQSPQRGTQASLPEYSRPVRPSVAAPALPVVPNHIQEEPKQNNNNRDATNNKRRRRRKKKNNNGSAPSSAGNLGVSKDIPVQPDISRRASLLVDDGRAPLPETRSTRRRNQRRDRRPANNPNETPDLPPEVPLTRRSSRNRV